MTPGILSNGDAFTNTISDDRSTPTLPDSTYEEAAHHRAIFDATIDPILVADAQGRIVDANLSALALLDYARDKLLVLHVADLTTLDPAETDTEFARLVNDGNWWGEVELRRKDGSLIHVDVRAERLDLPTHTLYVAMIHDLSDQRRERWLSIAYTINRYLTVGRDLQAVAPNVLRQIMVGLGFDAAVLWIRDERFERLQCNGVSAPTNAPARAFASLCRQTTFARGQGVPGRVWNSGQPLRTHLRQTDDDLERLKAARAGGLNAILGYPIRAGHTVVGVIECFSVKERIYNPEVVWLLRAISGQLGQFVERHRAESALQGLVAGFSQSRDAERQRLARDLQDSSAQSFAGLGAQLTHLEEMFSGRSERADAVLAEMRKLSEQGLREVSVLADLSSSQWQSADGAESTDPTIDRSSIFQAFSASSPIGIFLMDQESRCTYTNQRYQMISGASFDTSRDDGWMNSIHPDDRSKVIESWRTTFKRKGEFADELRFLRPDGIVRWVHARAAPLLSGTGDLIGYVGTVEDVTDRVDAHRLLERRLVALTEIAGGLFVEQPMSATLDTIAANVVESTNADACLIALLSEGLVANHTVGSVGIPATMISTAEAVYRTGSGAFRLHAFRDQHPVILRDLRQRIEESVLSATSPSITNAPWDTALFVPVMYRGQISGTVNAYYPPDVAPSDDELAFLLAVARHAALAIETTRLAATEREKAALEERQRLARELHDSVSQVLYGIGMGASAIRESLDSDPEQAREPTEYVLSLVQAGLAEMRALIFELRPDSIAQEGLVAALRKQAESMHARHGLAIEVMLDEEPEASLEMKEAMYRVGQEAMNNVAKHARASRLSVRLLVSAGSMVLEIEDNGEGFDSTAEYPGHLGLQSMRERIAQLGGDVLISGCLGSGTRIRAELLYQSSSA